MKLLKRLLLINWHYISMEMMDFKRVNFLTGKNASGKSTIIDALQLLMLGDTSGYFFNKAANERSKRTLKGYLKGELADSGSEYLYLRKGRFSSYITAEILDTVKGRHSTYGVVFDVFEDDNISHRFFIADGRIPDNGFVADDRPLDYNGLQAYYRSTNTPFQAFSTNRAYQNAFRAQMGSLNEKFFSLFKKAVSFSPITDIQGFISEFLCDVEKRIDISDMQDNIRYYKRIENEAEIIRGRITSLDNISKLYEDFCEESDRFMQQSYLIDRAHVEQNRLKVWELKRELEEAAAARERIVKEIDDAEREIKNLRQENERLRDELNNTDAYRMSERLKEEAGRIREKIAKCRDLEKRLTEDLKKHCYKWREYIEQVGSLTTSQEGISDLGNSEAAAKAHSTVNGILKHALEDVGVIEKKLLEQARKHMNEFTGLVFDKYYAAVQLLDTFLAEMDVLKNDIQTLRRGLRPYGKKLLELRRAINEELKERHGREISVDIFCELLEITDSNWQDAIEGYLHTQKFYLIVPPEYFQEALGIYERLKFDRGFYDIGLVDIEKIIEKGAKVKENSLALEIETENKYARAYADYLLGRVIKCERVEELRNHKTAITRTCMLYSGYTARQLNPARYEIPYIGRKSLERQIQIKTARYEEIAAKSEDLKAASNILGRVKGMESFTEMQVEGFIRDIGDIRVKSVLQEKQKEISHRLGSLDLSVVMRLNEKIKKTRETIDKLDADVKSKISQEGVLRQKCTGMEKGDIPAAEKDIKEGKRRISESYDSEWAEQTGEPRFIRELEKRKTPVHIIESFYSQIKRTESQRDKKRNTLIDARSDYNSEYKMSYDVSETQNNTAYDRELKRLGETLLPEYEEKIEDAVSKAQNEFREDFISKLKYNIDTVHSQIKELNAALKDLSFGRDRYRFEVRSDQYYKKYYDMIMDDMLMEGYNLFSSQFMDKHKDAINELFKLMVDVGEGGITSDQRAEIEKNIEKYTDYRTYLKFDLIVSDGSGSETRLSRMLNKKSGGETQTPFYISVLASFARVYRISKSKDTNTLRLIVFDEAFNKMDPERIQESIRLLKLLGFQSLISAPTEKVPYIALHADRNLCAARVGSTTVVKPFDPRKLMGEDEV